MPRKIPPKDAVEKAAYLASLGKMQKEIALILDVTPVTSHRLIMQAKEEGILKELTPELCLDEQRRREIEQTLFGRDVLYKKLANSSNQTLKGLEIFETIDTVSPLLSLASAASSLIVDDILSGVKFVAVTWGNTIREIVRSIENVTRKRTWPPSSVNQLEFVQVCGDPQGAISEPSLRCSTLVSNLNTAFKDSPNSPYTFSISASIPRRFSSSEVKIIRDFIQEVGGYSNVFSLDQNSTPRLNVKIDRLLTSCSSGQRGDDRWLSECAKVAGIAEEKLEALTIGNIGGYWLPRQDLTKMDHSLLEDINARWNGIVLDDIKKIAQDGGVILVAAEEYKASIVLHLIQNGLVSRLLISTQLEARITELLQDIDEI